MVLRLGDIDYSLDTVKPILSLCRPNKEVIDILNTAYDVSFDESLGALNELEFKLPIYIEKHHQVFRNDSIEKIKGRYIVLLELGNYKEYFIINQLGKSGSSNDEYLEAKCLSLAYELNDDIVRGYNVVSYNCSSILKDLLKDTIWSVKYIDSDFDLQYRSFEVSSSTVFESIIELAKTFNALFLYDTENRTISFFKPQNVGEDKGLSVSYGKYLESVNQEDNSEEIITRLEMYGKEGISIQEIVPSGQKYIEDFSYFMYPYEESYSFVESIMNGSTILNSWVQNGFPSNFTQINSGVRIDGTTTASYIVSDNAYNDVSISFAIKNLNNNYGAKYGGVFGFVDSNNYYYFTHERVMTGSVAVRLMKVTNGISQQVAFDDKKVGAWSANIDYKIDFEVIKGVFSLKIDNVLSISYVNKSIPNGQVGFYVLGNIGVFDNIKIKSHSLIVNSRSEFLSDELCYYIKRYEELLDNSKGDFNTLVGYRTTFYNQLGILDDELAVLNLDKKKLLDERDILNTRIARNLDSINKADNTEQPTDFLENTNASLVSQRDAKLIEITSKEAQITSKKSDIAVVQSQFDAILHEIDMYRLKISLENNFPQPYLSERIQHTITKEWQDNNIIDSEALLKEGLKVFDEYRQQKITVTVDLVDFLSMVSEQKNWGKLVLGDEFDIEHERLGFTYKAKMIGISRAFEGKKIKVTISNVKDLYSNKSKFLELLYKTNRISSSISMKEWEWDLSLENKGSINEIINNMWDANKQAILGAKDQVIEISDRGLLIRDESNPNVYLVGMNGMIAITNDGGNTWKHAITSEGIVGENIYGKIIMGVNLAIEDESGILVIQGSRGKIYNRDKVLRMHFGLVEENGLCGEAFGLISENEITQVKVTDCEGFVINRKNPSEADYPTGWEKVFWTNTDGTIFAHDLVVSNIKVVQDKEWDKLIMDAELGYFDLGFFSKIVKDGKLTTDEKLQLITELMRIGSSYMGILSQANKYMYVSRDDDINFNAGFNGADFPRQLSNEAKMNLQPLKTAYLNLINFMASYVRVTSVNPHEPLQIDVRHEMTETTSDLGNNRERLILLFKTYYDEYDKLSDKIEDVIVYQGISMGKNYNNVYVGEHGLVVVRNDRMYRAYLNATNGLALEKWENGVWVKKLYATLGDPMWADGTLVAEGLVTKNLRIVDAHMNDRITFDWYDGITIFGDGATIYLNANDAIRITDLSGDDKFWVDMDGNLYAKDITTHNLSIVDGNLGEKIIFDHNDGITINGNNGEQIRLNANEGIAIDVNNDKRFWIGTDGSLYAKRLIVMDDLEAPIEVDGSFISDLTVNKLLTLNSNSPQDVVHIQDNYIKLKTQYNGEGSDTAKFKLHFNGSGASAYPEMIWGAESGGELGKFYKNNDRFALEYTPPNFQSKIWLNQTDSDGSGQAMYLQSTGGIRLDSSKKVVMRTSENEYIRVIAGEDVAMKKGEATVMIKSDQLLLQWNSSNYIKVSASGVEIKGTRLDLN